MNRRCRPQTSATSSTAVTATTRATRRTPAPRSPQPRPDQAAGPSQLPFTDDGWYVVSRVVGGVAGAAQAGDGEACPLERPVVAGGVLAANGGYAGAPAGGEELSLDPRW